MILSRLMSKMRYDTVWDVFSRSLDITSRAVTQYRLEADRPDVVIRPQVFDIDTLDIVDVREVAKRARRLWKRRCLSCEVCSPGETAGAAAGKLIIIEVYNPRSCS